MTDQYSQAIEDVCAYLKTMEYFTLKDGFEDASTFIGFCRKSISGDGFRDASYSSNGDSYPDWFENRKIVMSAEEFSQA